MFFNWGARAACTSESVREKKKLTLSLSLCLSLLLKKTKKLHRNRGEAGRRGQVLRGAQRHRRGPLGPRHGPEPARQLRRGQLQGGQEGQQGVCAARPGPRRRPFGPARHLRDAPGPSKGPAPDQEGAGPHLQGPRGTVCAPRHGPRRRRLQGDAQRRQRVWACEQEREDHAAVQRGPGAPAVRGCRRGDRAEPVRALR